MLDFNFVNPTQILFGKGKIAEIENKIPANPTFFESLLNSSGTQDFYFHKK